MAYARFAALTQELTLAELEAFIRLHPETARYRDLILIVHGEVLADVRRREHGESGPSDRGPG